MKRGVYGVSLFGLCLGFTLHHLVELLGLLDVRRGTKSQKSLETMIRWQHLVIDWTKCSETKGRIISDRTILCVICDVGFICIVTNNVRFFSVTVSIIISYIYSISVSVNNSINIANDVSCLDWTPVIHWWCVKSAAEYACNRPQLSAKKQNCPGLVAVDSHTANVYDATFSCAYNMMEWNNDTSLSRRHIRRHL